MRGKNRTFLAIDEIVIVLISCKPIADMFYTARWLDGIMLVGIILLACISVQKKDIQKIHEHRGPVICFLICCLSLLMSNIGTYWIAWIKLMSIFPVYVVGVCFSQEKISKLIRGLQIIYSIVLLINVVMIVAGDGYQVWAKGAETFSGMYFFKTDLAVAMAQVILLAMASYPMRWQHYLMAFLAVTLALLSNSRIFFAVIILLVLICGIWAHLKGTKLQFAKVVFTVCIILVLSVGLLVGIASIPFFRERNFISFTAEGSLWEMMVYNLMFRNIIWKDMLEGYLSGDIWHIVLGNGISSQMPWYDAHSLYVSAIYKFGIVGCVALVYLCVWAWTTLRDKADRRLYFLNIGFWIFFLIAGISYTTAASTQYTWLMAFFIAVVASRQKQESIDQNDETRESINCS